uniref:Uncharacterized protein MANES_S093400 n=1 Tax=Rhizophora mucronata TaxID=61149 RepID=A0A2P2NRA0_RHIMU
MGKQKEAKMCES